MSSRRCCWKQGYLAHKKQGYLAHKKQGYLAHKNYLQVLLDCLRCPAGVLLTGPTPRARGYIGTSLIRDSPPPGPDSACAAPRGCC